MKRRGFLAAIAAVLAAPWFKRPEPGMAVISFEDVADLPEVYGSNGHQFWILEADGSYSFYPVQSTVQQDVEMGDGPPIKTTNGLRLLKRRGGEEENMSGWIGVDLDGTLAEYGGWQGPGDIGKPIPKMVARVKRWIKAGKDVRIFTARVAMPHERAVATKAIKAWCKEHIGQELPVTSCKDYGMVECWDDRAVQVIPNTGEPVEMRRRGK